MRAIIFPNLSVAILSTFFIITALQGQTRIECKSGNKDCSDVRKMAVTTDEADNDTGIAGDNPQSKPFTTKFVRSAFQLPPEAKRFISKDDLPAEKDAQTAPADDARELAKKLANPIASLISVPFQNNFDFGMGPSKDGFRYTLNFQPVIPVALNKKWNLISRTILPIIAQHNVVGTSSQFGLGDTIQSFFFSPNKTEPFVWGVGPQVLIPTGTNEFLGSQKFGLGPTFVILKQKKEWTVGALINHTWSVFGKDSRAAVNSTFIQPFLAYTTKSAWTFTLNTESTYDWTGKSWNVPIHFQVAKLVKGKRPVSVGVALRCWTTSSPGGPQGCGFRFVIVPLYPVK